MITWPTAIRRCTAPARPGIAPVRRLHAWIKVKQTIDPEAAEYVPHRIRRNHQAQLGAAFCGTFVSPHDGTRSRAITEPGRAHVDDHDGMTAEGQGQLFRDTGRISQVDLFGQRHDHRAPRQDTSHGYHQLRGVWTKPGLFFGPENGAVGTPVYGQL